MDDIEQKRAENRNYLRAWRERARLTQDQLGALIDTSGSVIHLLEAGDRPLSPKWLRRLAPALNTTAGFLLDFHPDAVPEALEVLNGIDPVDLPSAMRALQGFRRRG